MASLRQDIDLDAHPDDVWAALRDFGALHERLVRGFVVDAELDGSDRVITFFNGMTARERLVGVDEEHRRLAYAILDGFDHYNGSAEVHPDGERCRLVWVVDVLPDDRAPQVGELMERGAEAMRRTLQRRMTPVTASQHADRGGPVGGHVAR
ncbi:MAG: SRPBCC family protein [Actinophytocola sp.]|uniref:SRPBCC family protein n=1 Tax=Actinophytocola sp. TaxID=1872138 RepID=UPI0013232C4F|nr:SRPBCC family protein [Actinophytocola sp.]MPZ81200.1 SRPBCC family protein [Actinophytocola sp.]